MNASIGTRSGMLTLVVVRHGETALNAAGRFQGHCEESLSPAGREQAAALRPLLEPYAAIPGARIVSSDLVRARETAALALPGRVATPEPRLRELHFGAFEGLTHDACLTHQGERFRAWIDDPRSVRPAGGETLAELETRVLAWLAAQPRTGVAVAVTHGGPAFVLLANALRIPFDRARVAGLAHGDAVRLLLPAREDSPVPLPIWMSDAVAGQARSGALARLGRTAAI